MTLRPAVVLLALSAALPAAATEQNPMLRNPAIDFAAHLRMADEAGAHRATRRLSEEEFIRMSREPGTVILDARSPERYNELHVRGAINLPFPDIAVESLAQLLPDKKTRILIYCNNNFANAPGPFPAKEASVALNISTYISLYGYGYRNVYELGPLVDLKDSKLAFDKR